MAFTMTQMHEHDLFVRAINIYIPAAKVWVEVRGWEDPRPQFAIRFKNGAVFEGQTKHAVINDAKVYADGLYRLTGEFP
jgi:hypothetical protein